MFGLRLFILPIIAVSMLGAILLQWRWAVGFNAQDSRWWAWLVQTAKVTGGLPDELLYPVYWTGIAAFFVAAAVTMIVNRVGTRTIAGNADARNTHGSARWAKKADVRRAALLGSSGVVVGGWKGPLRTSVLRHDGPEHVMAFAPTRSGKGVSLVVPTLLSWTESCLVLDIKGENYALTAGWRARAGQRVLRFEPAALAGSVRYNPMAEVRIGTDYQIADCQNIAQMIIDPEGKGLQDFWMKAGWEWMSAAILHVLYRVRHESGGTRTACLGDVHSFMSLGAEDPEDLDLGEGGKDDDSFNRLLDDMIAFDHRNSVVNAEVRRAAGRMRKRAAQERSGVHSSATVPLALYSDPIVVRNTSACDFRIVDLMQADHPASLYIVIPPSDIKRLRPLIRILLNQFLTRLTAEMEFDGGRSVKHYKHRLLLMLDEFTSVGKLEIFEDALAYMAGYGLKAFIIVQDLTQLQKAYGKEESITSNCHIRIAFAPNKIETARMLSDMSGKTTLIQRKRSQSRQPGQLSGNVSDSIAEVARPLMTADECMSLPGMRDGWFGRKKPGHMLIFVAGQPPIYGRQNLYFQDRELQRRSSIPAPTNDNKEGVPACA